MDKLGGDTKTWDIYVVTDIEGQWFCKGVNGQDNFKGSVGICRDPEFFCPTPRFRSAYLSNKARMLYC